MRLSSRILYIVGKLVHFIGMLLLFNFFFGLLFFRFFFWLALGGILLVIFFAALLVGKNVLFGTFKDSFQKTQGGFNSENRDHQNNNHSHTDTSGGVIDVEAEVVDNDEVRL
ncbi:MAG: hypothetical protein ABIG64_08195 [Candidatus Omnitrophota bacterium]